MNTEVLAPPPAAPPDSTAEMPAPIFEPHEKRGRYTTERLRAKRPDVYKAIATMSRERIGVLRIAEYLGVTPGTVLAVRKREGIIIDRTDLAHNMHEAAAMLVTTAQSKLSDPDAVAKLSIKDAAFAAATLSERADSMQGHATQIVEVQVVDPARDELNAALLQAMRPAQQLPPAIDVTPEPLKEDVQSVRDDVRIEKTDLPSPPAPAMPAEYAPGPMTAAAQVGQREDEK